MFEISFVYHLAPVFKFSFLQEPRQSLKLNFFQIPEKMSDRHWLDITTYSDHIGFTISTIANFVLILLLVFRPTKSYGSYKYLMITFCVFSLFYTSIETFLRPVSWFKIPDLWDKDDFQLIHIYDNTIFVIQRKRFQYSEGTARAISCSFEIKLRV